MKRIISFLAILTFPLLAHKLAIFADHSQGRLFIESYFSGGGACQNCELFIRNATGKLLHKDTLDQRGMAEIPIDTPPPYEIIVDAKLGHQATIRYGSAPDNPAPTTLIAKKSADISLSRILLGLFSIAALFFIIHKIQQRKAV